MSTIKLFLMNVWFILTKFHCSSLPNFVMIMVDDMGWGDVSYNNGTALTPNIDAMAASPHTIVFQRGYSGAPLCSPTRASVLTGRNGDRECIYSANVKGSQTMPLPTSTFTIAEAVKKADSTYQTALIGKWHLGDVYDKGEGHPVSTPGDNGFDYWLVTERNAATTTPNCRCEQFADTEDSCVYGHYENRTGLDDVFCSPYFYENDTNAKGVTEVMYKVDGNYNNDTENDRDSHFIVTKFEEWLNNADLTKPFLVMLWLHSPHIPYVMTDEIRDGCHDGTYCKSPPNGTNYTSVEVDYYGTIVDIDLEVGRVRQLLRDYDVHQNTFLWFNSDNGPQGAPASSGGLHGKKDDVWEGGIRVPTIMEWPDVIPNDSFVSNFPVVTHDLLPTILDVLDVESDTADWELDGISIMDTLRAGGVDGKNRSKAIGFTYLGGGLSLAWMDNDWKVVKNSNHCDDEDEDESNRCDAKLYNLVDDPYETTDLSAQYPQRFERMKDAMNDWYGDVIHSQVHDSKCIVDRINSYSEYVIIGIVVGVVCLCCCVLLICVALRLGWITLAFTCWCCCKCKKEIEEEIETAENAEAHERKQNEEQTNTGVEA